MMIHINAIKNNEQMSIRFVEDILLKSCVAIMKHKIHNISEMPITTNFINSEPSNLNRGIVQNAKLVC